MTPGSSGPPNESTEAAGRLVLVATPIGNLGDLSPRAVSTLAGVRRRSAARTPVAPASFLRTQGSTQKRLLSLNEHNEADRIPGVLARVGIGELVAVVSDAGTPGVSDPGGRLVAAAVAAGLSVEAVPGANAALDRADREWVADGPVLLRGVPARDGVQHRHRRLAAIADEERTVLIHESPQRLAATLADLADACGGERQVAVARELTKLHEEVWRGTLADAAAWFADRARSAARSWSFCGGLRRGAAASDGDGELESRLQTSSLGVRCPRRRCRGGGTAASRGTAAGLRTRMALGPRQRTSPTSGDSAEDGRGRS